MENKGPTVIEYMMANKGKWIAVSCNDRREVSHSFMDALITSGACIFEFNVSVAGSVSMRITV